MHSYKQYCALAKALDVIGDRWSLLIVRELSVRGPCRYTDLRFGLPGIATNLLADRLRELEQAGVVRREAAPPPIATTLFHLTPRGEALVPAMHALGRWGAPLLGEATDDDVFRSHWLSLPLRHIRDTSPDGPPLTIEVRTGDQPMLIETVDGEVRTRPGTAEHPDAILSGPHRLVIGVLMGQLDLDEACKQGLEFEGDRGILRRLRHEVLSPV